MAAVLTLGLFKSTTAEVTDIKGEYLLIETLAIYLIVKESCGIGE